MLKCYVNPTSLAGLWFTVLCKLREWVNSVSKQICEHILCTVAILTLVHGFLEDLCAYQYSVNGITLISSMSSPKNAQNTFEFKVLSSKQSILSLKPKQLFQIQEGLS